MKEIYKTSINNTEEKIEDMSKVDEPVIPDWLKSSLSDDTKPTEDVVPASEVTKTESVDLNKPTSGENSSKEDNDITKVDEPVIPDWLKSSLSDDTKTTKEDTPSLKPKNDIIKPSEDKEKTPAKKTISKKKKEKSDTTKKN
jgi:hypothetical protein